MDKITSLEQYNRVIDRVKKSGCKLSNCFFLPAAIRQKISENSLFFQPIDNGLLLLDNQPGFYRCYYYLSENFEYKGLELDKPAVIELPFNNTLNGKQLLQVEKIESMGFKLGRESRMMRNLPEKINLNVQLSTDIYICRKAEHGDVAQILDLLNRCFNPLYSFLPTMRELLTAIHERRVLVIQDGNKIAAALISSMERRIASIKQVAVEPSYRRQGLGRALLQAYHSMYISKALAFQHWVDLNNTAATKMYLNFGYEFNSKKANEYILMEKEG